MNPALVEILRAVRAAPTATLVAAWVEVFRRPATIEEAMTQRWTGLAIAAEMFRRGSINCLPEREATV